VERKLVVVPEVATVESSEEWEAEEEGGAAAVLRADL
jgi:hypothetical protein